MSPPVPTDVAALFDRINLYYPDLPSALRGVLQPFALDQQLADCILTLTGVGTLVMTRAGGQLTCDWLNDTLQPASLAVYDSESAAGVDAAVRAAQWVSAPRHYAPPPLVAPMRTRTLPLTYAGQPQGELHLRWSGGGIDGPMLALAGDVAQQAVFLAKRSEGQRWAAAALGRPYGLVGLGKAARALDRFLEKAAPSPLPVLLTGEFGTETMTVAALIHGLGPYRQGPFVPVLAADPTGEPADWLARASGGTLFIREIEALAPALQSQLLHYMPSRLGQGQGAERPPVRLVAATTVDLKAAAQSGHFSRALLAELDFLAITLPPLRDRPDDLPALIGAALAQHGYGADARVTPDLLAACRAYAWPENGFELERVIARLAVMSDGGPIALADIRQHTPWLLPTPDPVAPARPRPAADPDHWVRIAATRDAAALAAHHPALKKALFYLGEHFTRPLSLEELAGQAHVSPSHLSYLFRTELQTTFKALLGRLRVLKASELLAADPRQPITDVAMSVGFADLSHFEKSFRRHWGQSPREFRREAQTPPARRM